MTSPRPVRLALLVTAGLVPAAWGQTPDRVARTAEPLTAAEATAAAEGVKTEPRYALIVGVPDYEDPRIPDLPVCEADARAVHALLTDPAIGGVPPANATLLIGEAASQRAVERALNALRAVPQNATVFIYFSGHGARVGDETFLIPQDAEAAFLSGTSISQTDLDRYLKQVPAARVVQFVDACFAAGLRTSGGQTKAFAADAEAALQSFTGSGRIFFGAAGEDEEALTAPDKQRSVFTLHLLEGLSGKADANGDGVVTAYEVSGYLDSTVTAEAAKRGGLHRPRVDIPATVRDASRYPLTIHAPALEARTAAAAAMAKRLDALDGLFLRGALTRPQLDQAAALLKCSPTDLTRRERTAHAAVLAVTDGTASAERLARALDLLGPVPAKPAATSPAPAAMTAAERATVPTPPATAQPEPEAERNPSPNAPVPMRLKTVVPEPRTLEGHSVDADPLAVTQDGRRAVSGSWDGTVKVWDLTTGACERTLEGHFSNVLAVAVMPDGRRALSGGWDKTVKVWDLTTGACERTLEGHSAGVSAVAVTPDGRRALSGGWDRTVKVWDLTTGECERTLEGHSEHVWAVAVTPDGRRAVSGSGDHLVNTWTGELKVWDLTTGECERTLEGNSETVLAVAAFLAVAATPDGRRAVSGSWNGTVKVWDLTTGECERTLEGHSEKVGAVAVTPDGRRAVSGSGDGTLKVWDLTTGECERTLEGHFSDVRAVAVTPDGRRVVSGSGDFLDHKWTGELKIWDLFEPDE